MHCFMYIQCDVCDLSQEQSDGSVLVLALVFSQAKEPRLHGKLLPTCEINKNASHTL